jgi:hypothetical protein
MQFNISVFVYHIRLLINDWGATGFAMQSHAEPVSMPDPQRWPVQINDGLADAIQKFFGGLQSASISVDYDGEPTEVRKCGFGQLNRRLGDY